MRAGWVVAAAVVLATSVVLGGGPGCARAPTSSPEDPGGRRLAVLREDPGADLAPPGAERTGSGHRVALDGRPSVVWREYRTGAAFDAVAGFYRERLAGLGWRFLGRRRLPATGDDFEGAEVVEFERDAGRWTALLVVERHAGEKGAFRVVLTAPPVQPA